MIARTPRRVVLDDGSEVFAHPIAPEIPALAHGWDRSFARCRRYRISRARIGGHACGVVTRLHKDDWSAIDPDGAAVWDEQTGKNWPTLRVACEKLAAAVEDPCDDVDAKLARIHVLATSLDGLLPSLCPANRTLEADEIWQGVFGAVEEIQRASLARL